MPRGRPKKSEESIRLSIYISRSLIAKVDLLLLDPLSGKPTHGARSQLIERLLREWLAERRREHAETANESEEQGD